MKRTILILLTALLSAAPLLAQYSPCYEAAFTEGKRLYNAGQYAQAKKYFNEAKACPDPNMDAVKEWVGKCEKKIAENNKRNEIEAEKKRKEIEETRRQNEAQRLEAAMNAPIEITIGNVRFKMIKVEGGTYLMGAQDDNPKEPNYDADADKNSKPVHSVSISSFYMCETEVTQSLWKQVTGKTVKEQSRRGLMAGEGDDNPMYYVNYEDIVNVFLPRLNQLTGLDFRLPTEAEWEYAAKGGNKNRGYRFAGGNNIDKVAWYCDNSEDVTHKVKTKMPNELGLYDMSGNVWEYCQDCWYNYDNSKVIGIAPDCHVLRGGSYRHKSPLVFCRTQSTYRAEYYGFRLALSLSRERLSELVSVKRPNIVFLENQKIESDYNVQGQAFHCSFSVSLDRQVRFASGNLQYQASTNTWRFAEHQWDIIGESNKKIGKNNKGWIDLFGWGTGNDPLKMSHHYSDFNSFSDWGNNRISNGGDKKWRTLTKEEWEYVFDKRDTASTLRYAVASVNGVNGIVLLPDNWDASLFLLKNPNKQFHAKFSDNVISQSDWVHKFETNGAVFLPAGGWRYDSKEADAVGKVCRYWSSTSLSSSSCFCVRANDDYLNSDDTNLRTAGLSVRLVCPAD